MQLCLLRQPLQVPEGDECGEGAGTALPASVFLPLF